MIEHCCAFTGHRPHKFPWKYDEMDSRCVALKAVLAEQIAALVNILYTQLFNLLCDKADVELNNRLVCFDIKQLGKQLKKLGMLIVQDQVWNRVTVNRAAKKSTRYFMDEFHLLLKDEQTAAYSVEIWKRFRKWGGKWVGLHENHAGVKLP